MNRLERNKWKETTTWLAGLQWFFFIFANIVIIPITIGEAFQLQSETVVSMLQLSFIVTGVACLLQALFGHHRPIMEGQSGLWWGIFLTLVMSASAQGMSLEVLGGSLALGVIISGIITILIGVAGVSSLIGRLFKPGVMGVFMFLLGLTLIQIFLQGMLGIPFGVTSGSNVSIHLPTATIAILIAIIVIIITIRSPVQVKSYALLIGIVVGWIIYALIFGTESVEKGNGQWVLFPLGKLTWNGGIVLTAVLAGLLNISNTFGAIKGTDEMYGQEAGHKAYGSALSITGIATIVAGIFGLVPYAPYVSSIGFLRQTNILDKVPFIIGSGLFLMMGVIPSVGAFFSTLPLSIGSAVLFVAYLQLFHSAIQYFKQITIHVGNVYRVAIPLFSGAIIMMLPTTYFQSLPHVIQPFVSNGLIIGIILALLLENVIDWERI